MWINDESMYFPAKNRNIIDISDTNILGCSSRVFFATQQLCNQMVFPVSEHWFNL